jgi:hypothetical protein
MKILAVLALLLSLCSGFVDFTLTSTANATQSLGYTNDSPGNCVVTQKYDSASNTLSGSFTCTKLNGNVTSVHIHDVGTYSSVADTTGSVLADCPITVNADAVSGSFSCVFADKISITAICNDQCYWNFHTLYDSLGEVRANLVAMAQLCNVAGGITLDGSVTSVGSAPTTGIEVPNFYVGYFATALKGTGGGYLYVSWDSAAQVATIAGNTWGLTGPIEYIYAYFPNDAGSSFYTFTSYSIPTGRPFSYKTSYLTDWNLARIMSGTSYISIQTTANPTGELQVTLDATNYPSFSGNCVPYTSLKYDATKVLTCQYGSTSYSIDSTCSAGYFCSISSSDVKYCSSLDYCYNCACGSTSSDLPLAGSACCDSTNCNSFSLAVLNCLTPANGAGSISVGLMVSIFVAVFMKWFN